MTATTPHNGALPPWHRVARWWQRTRHADQSTPRRRAAATSAATTPAGATADQPQVREAELMAAARGLCPW